MGEVGYRNPPKEHQFKPGNRFGGNRKGAPHLSRRMKDMLDREINCDHPLIDMVDGEPVILKDGRPGKRIKAADALLLASFMKILTEGDIAHINAWITRTEGKEPIADAPEIDADAAKTDEEILMRYAERALRNKQAGKAERKTADE